MDWKKLIADVLLVILKHMQIEMPIPGNPTDAQDADQPLQTGVTPGPVPGADNVVTGHGSEVPPPSVTSAEQAAPAINNIELDSQGLPWDERIHAGTKTKYKADTGMKKKGEWKWKKGVDEAEVERISTENRAKYPLPGSGVDAPAAPAAPQTQAPAAPQTQAPAAPQTQAPAAPQTQAPAAPQTQDSEMSWVQLVTLVGQRSGQDPNFNATVKAVCDARGVQGGLSGLQNTPELVQAVAVDLGLA